MSAPRFDVSRRRLLQAGAAFGTLALAGCASTAPSGPSIGRVVVVGGGFGGATAARYLRLWGGNVDVTLVERNTSFISCPISNLVVGGYKEMADITRGYDTLKALGVKVVQGEVSAIDAAAKKAEDRIDSVVVPVVGDVEYDGGWVSPLNHAVYPPMATRRTPAFEGWHPAFKKDSVFRRPDDEPFKALFTQGMVRLLRPIITWSRPKSSASISVKRNAYSISKTVRLR